MGVQLSLCMIVKDEAHNLPRALASVAGVAGELLVVDTGSTDGTPEVARSLGARVLAFPWNGSFAAARNFALDHAQGEWALILDADEALAPGEAGKIPPLLADAGRDAWLCPVLTYLGDPPGGMAVRDHRVFLVRRRPGYRYTGDVHETLLPAVPPGRVGWAGVTFLHYGYLDEARRRDRASRNQAILRRNLAGRPGDPFLLYCLGTEYLAAGDTQAAAEALAASLAAAPPDAHYRSDLYAKLAACGEARRWLEAGVQEYPDYTDLWFLLAAHCREAGEWLAAEACLRLCLALGEAPPHYLSVVGVGSHLAWQALGDLYMARGMRGAARAAYGAALRARPVPGPALSGWAAAAAGALPQDVVQEAAATFDLGSEPTAVAVARALAAAGAQAAAAAVLRAACAAGAGPGAYRALVEILWDAARAAAGRGG